MIHAKLLCCFIVRTGRRFRLFAIFLTTTSRARRLVLLSFFRFRTTFSQIVVVLRVIVVVLRVVVIVLRVVSVVLRVAWLTFFPQMFRTDVTPTCFARSRLFFVIVRHPHSTTMCTYVWISRGKSLPLAGMAQTLILTTRRTCCSKTLKTHPGRLRRAVCKPLSVTVKTNVNTRQHRRMVGGVRLC